MNIKLIEEIIDLAYREDVGEGDHTSMATIPADKMEKAVIISKGEGIIAGVSLVKRIIAKYNKDIHIEVLKEDGQQVKNGDEIVRLEGQAIALLKLERLMLNFMQRMSGIATLTRKLTDKIGDNNCYLLDTRKTTPGLREVEKWAVRIGGGKNHRQGLYDMILIKDNHIDNAGGVREAILNTHDYLKKMKLELPIEIEVRNFEELDEALAIGKVDRIMLDNFTPEELKKAIEKIDGDYETEASGGIDENNIKAYAETGVNYISSGSLTHSYKSLDISMKSLG